MVLYQWLSSQVKCVLHGVFGRMQCVWWCPCVLTPMLCVYIVSTNLVRSVVSLALPQFICHHHHMSVIELGHLLTCSGLAHLEVSSEVCHDSFCQLGNSVSLSWVVCHEAFCLHVVSSSSCIPAVCVEPVLFLIPLQCVNLFCNLSKCILLFFSYISSLLLLFSWHPLLS